MIINRPRRLPGFRFEVETPPPGDVLPRMDIAVFVGFASAGPLHMPVVVEDEAEFQKIFGDDLPLAWDAQRGEQLCAHLGPSVRAFFRNGGRRCWIVRVAGDASESTGVDRPETDFFPIPGLLELTGEGLRPAFARARSPGAWFDSFRVGAALSSESIKVETADIGLASLDVILASPDDLRTGDLLRLRFSDENLLAFVLVESISVPPKSPPESRRNLYRTAQQQSTFLSSRRVAVAYRRRLGNHFHACWGAQGLRKDGAAGGDRESVTTVAAADAASATQFCRTRSGPATGGGAGAGNAPARGP